MTLWNTIDRMSSLAMVAFSPCLFEFSFLLGISLHIGHIFAVPVHLISCVTFVMLCPSCKSAFMAVDYFAWTRLFQFHVCTFFYSDDLFCRSASGSPEADDNFDVSSSAVITSSYSYFLSSFKCRLHTSATDSCGSLARRACSAMAPNSLQREVYRTKYWGILIDSVLVTFSMTFFGSSPITASTPRK